MNVISFVIGAVLFLGGVLLFGFSWDGETFYWMWFVAGIITVSVSIAIPFHLLKRIEG